MVFAEDSWEKLSTSKYFISQGNLGFFKQIHEEYCPSQKKTKTNKKNPDLEICPF